MKILHISDTHLQPFPEMEPADLLVHSGDGMNYGDLPELPRLIAQFEPIYKNYKKIIFLAGNHDWIFETNLPLVIEEFKRIPNLEVVTHGAIEFEGVKIFASSYQPFFCDWAFNVHPGDALRDKYKEIPDDTEILITHCPPKGMLDYVVNSFNPDGKHVGSLDLELEIPRLTKLKAHMFGHIHSSRGQKLENGVEFSNGCICDERYQSVHKANVIEII